MARTVDKARVSRVAEFLRRIDRGDDVRLLVRDINGVAENLGPAELAAAGRSLLDQGYPPPSC